MQAITIEIKQNEDGSTTIADTNEKTRLYIGFSGQESNVEFDGDDFAIIIDDPNDLDSLEDMRESIHKLLNFLNPDSWFESD